jgi:hypothetical protein
MKNKRVANISLVITFLLIITLFLYLSTFVQPKIIFTTQINKVSDTDYKKILANNTKVIFPDISIEKFRRIELQVKIIAPFGIINHANIEKDASQQYLIQQYLKDNNKIQILGGNYFAQGNGMEYDENMEIYLKNISEDELKGILGNFKIKILWKNIWNIQDKKILYFKDYLK